MTSKHSTFHTPPSPGRYARVFNRTRAFFVWMSGWDTAVMVGLGLIVIGAAVLLSLPGCASVRVDPAKAESSRKVEDAWSRTQIIIYPKGESK